MFQIQVNDSDLQENAWLHLYAQVAAYSKWNVYMVRRKSLEKCVYSFVWGSCTLLSTKLFVLQVDHLPLEINKAVVQTKEGAIESSLKLKSSNAIFYISFKTRGGAEFTSIVRQTRDGRPQHMCLEVKNVEMDK